jgi:RecA/RadA recombinase
MPLSKEKKNKINKLKSQFIKDNKINEDEIKMGFLNEDPKIGVIERLPTGIISFDVVTNGGFAKGKINQIFGGESAGKSTMFQVAMGHWQKIIDDFFTAYLPSEKSFDREWAIQNGCDPEMLWIFEALNAEMNLDFCMKCADPSSGVDCLIIDTLQALSSVKEVYKKSNGKITKKEKSVEDDSMALIPRLYSQFLRMYTSRSVDKLTLILASQVRTDLSPMANGAKRATGGNAIGHYNVLSVKMTRTGKSDWPTSDLPPNSYPGKFVVDKSKVKGRYKGNELPFYFYKGSFDHNFNVVALAKHLDIFDGKKYTMNDGTEIKAMGFNDFFNNKATQEVIDEMESKLMPTYTKLVMGYEVPPAGEDNGEIEPEKID